MITNMKNVQKIWKELNETEKFALFKQMLDIDLDTASQCFVESSEVYKPNSANLAPVPADRRGEIKSLTEEQRKRYFDLGLFSIARGEVAALVVAGGQATDLGSDCPKGCIPLDLNIAPCDSLFGIQVAKILALEKLAKKAYPHYDGRIQWLVMTSKSNEAAIRKHLMKLLPEAGMSWEQVFTFCQSETPVFDFEGNVLMASKYSIVTSPNGNGGVYSALARHLPALKERGVKYFHVYSVDNILCKVADPLFIGYGIEKNADIVTKCVEKQPGELVGSVCFDGGKPRVVEYSELGQDLANKKADNGKLLFGDGTIANHLFSMRFLESFAKPSFHLPFHRAYKKIPYLNEKGQLVIPDKPNGIKLEQYLFDVFHLSKKFYMLTVDREDEFAPLKNPDSAGIDCPSFCRKAVANQSRKWLENAGAKVQVGNVYIRSSASYNGEGLESAFGRVITTSLYP